MTLVAPPATVRDVDDEQRMIGGDGLGWLARSRRAGTRTGNELVVPAVALVPRDVDPGAPNDDRLLDARGGRNRLVRARLEGQDDAVPPRSVLRDEHLRLEVGETVGERVCRQRRGHQG